MKTQPYYVKMSDGRICRIEMAQSAGDAINIALWQNRGVKAVECFQGKIGQDKKGWLADTGEPGVIYDVPPHEAIPHDAKKPVQRRPKDTSEVMPFMSEITKEGVPQ